MKGPGVQDGQGDRTRSRELGLPFCAVAIVGQVFYKAPYTTKVLGILGYQSKRGEGRHYLVPRSQSRKKCVNVWQLTAVSCHREFSSRSHGARRLRKVRTKGSCLKRFAECVRNDRPPPRKTATPACRP